MKTIGNIIHNKTSPLIFYDYKGRQIYYEISPKKWCKRQYDSSGFQIYYENAYGEIEDYR